MSQLHVQTTDMADESEKKGNGLTDDQLDYAEELLAELHPIENVPICEAYPILGLACCCLPPYPAPKGLPGDDR